ncbi:hypothetical protein MNBD_NITROSPIRAE02-897 [hydrothermal vent metagenome]|uniref:Uncharacterized protein n=1 Tax=hydrothermal vent metagenome TaxID=652676 RepID=A0A3B1CPF2_9ZZZZ
MSENEKDRSGDPETTKWWVELEDKKLSELSWCCRLIVETGLEALQWFDSTGEVHNIYVNYCPKCGTNLSAYLKGFGGAGETH